MDGSHREDDGKGSGDSQGTVKELWARDLLMGEIWICPAAFLTYHLALSKLHRLGL